MIEEIDASDIDIDKVEKIYTIEILNDYGLIVVQVEADEIPKDDFFSEAKDIENAIMRLLAESSNFKKKAPILYVSEDIYTAIDKIEKIYKDIPLCNISYEVSDVYLACSGITCEMCIGDNKNNRSWATDELIGKLLFMIKLYAQKEK